MERRSDIGGTPSGTGGDGGVSVEQLRNELRQGTGDDDTGVRLAPEQDSEAILDRVLDRLDATGFRFDDETVKGELEEILLLLVAHRDGDTHGKGLMGDLAAVFDTRLSPGTVYPRLHELEESGLLRVQELVRTKEYRIDDTEGMYERVERAMAQHLVLGLFFQSALAEFDAER